MNESHGYTNIFQILLNKILILKGVFTQKPNFLKAQVPKYSCTQVIVYHQRMNESQRNDPMRSKATTTNYYTPAKQEFLCAKPNVIALLLGAQEDIYRYILTKYYRDESRLPGQANNHRIFQISLDLSIFSAFQNVCGSQFLSTWGIVVRRSFLK